MLYFLGSNGKVGKKILDNINNSIDLKNYNEIVILDRPPYDIDNKNDKKIFIICIYSRNIIDYINTILCIRKINSSNKRSVIIELCSLLQLARFYDILSHKKYILYYINRSFQSFICSLLLYRYSYNLYKRIYFGKLSNTGNLNNPSEVSPSFIAKSILKILDNKYIEKTNNKSFTQLLLLSNRIAKESSDIQILFNRLIVKFVDDNRFIVDREN